MIFKIFFNSLCLKPRCYIRLKVLVEIFLVFILCFYYYFIMEMQITIDYTQFNLPDVLASIYFVDGWLRIVSFVDCHILSISWIACYCLFCGLSVSIYVTLTYFIARRVHTLTLFVD